jgi:hypothetical protein
MTGCYYGPTETWKIVYYPKELNGGKMGVALVEADCHQQAMYTFQQEYAGQYFTIQSCKKLLG